MRNGLTRKGHPALLMVFSLWTFASGAAAQGRQTLDEAIQQRRVAVTLEGLEAGRSVQLVVKNLTDEKLLLLLPQGNMSFNLGRATVTAFLEKPLSIDLEKQGTYKATFPQVGSRMRMISGKVTLRQTANGLETAFENLMWGPAPKP